LVSYVGVYDRSVGETVSQIVNGDIPEIGIQRDWYY